jgi:hypothetical protein
MYQKKIIRTTPKTDSGYSKTFTNIQMSRKILNELRMAYTVFPRAQIGNSFSHWSQKLEGLEKKRRCRQRMVSRGEGLPPERSS